MRESYKGDESKLSSSLFDGTYDSEWWRATRGVPPFYVIIGIWLLDGPAALAVGGIPGGLVSAALVWAGICVGLIDRHESLFTPRVMAILLLGFGIAVILAWRFLRRAVRTTRLFLLLRHYSAAAIDRALDRYECDLEKLNQSRYR